MNKITNYLNKVLLVGVVYAAAGPQNISIEPPAAWNALAGYTVGGIVSTIIKLILIAAAVIAFVFLVVGGIKWITSGGDKEGTQAAQKTLTAALIGLIIVFAAWAIMSLVERFFGFNILSNLEIPTLSVE